MSAVWESLDPRTHKWIPYSIEHTHQLEAAFATKGSISLDIRGAMFNVDTNRMAQQNGSGGHRRVRRVLTSVEVFPECRMCCGNSHPLAAVAKCGCQICTQCIKRHIEAEINDKGKVTKVQCPYCKTALEQADIFRGAAPAVAERWDRLVLHRFLQSQPNFVYCKSSCGSGQLHEGGAERPIVTCVACAKQSCFSCDVPWHSGVTCAAYQEAIRGDSTLATEALLMATTKKCPMCAASIEKNDGCDHMTCQHCLGEFCWLCLADFKRIFRYGNHHHQRTCRHWSDYIPGHSEDEEGDPSLA
jgi:hypothetical protein